MSLSLTCCPLPSMAIWLRRRRTAGSSWQPPGHQVRLVGAHSHGVLSAMQQLDNIAHKPAAEEDLIVKAAAP